MSLIDFLFPKRCLGCGKVGQYFCPSCLKSVNSRKTPLCPYCAKFSALGLANTRCLPRFYLDGLVTVFYYRGIIKKAISRLKYQFVTDLSDELVSQVTKTVKKNKNQTFPRFDNSWTLVPVPLHRLRENWRGFNQSALLGEKIAQKMNLNFCPDLLLRHKYTRPQVKIKDKKSRYQNTRGAFSINPESNFKTKNSKIIIFDDVWTTGSTIKECARVLKKKGAQKVWGLTIAR